MKRKLKQTPDYCFRFSFRAFAGNERIEVFNRLGDILNRSSKVTINATINGRRPISYPELQEIEKLFLEHNNPVQWGRW